MSIIKKIFNSKDNKTEDTVKKNAEITETVMKAEDKTTSENSTGSSYEDYSKQYIIDCVNKAIDIMENCSSSSDYKGLFDGIKDITKDIDLAFELFCFIPEIYCGVLLPEVQYSNKAAFVMPDKSTNYVNLEEHSTYNIIKTAASERLLSNFDQKKAQKVLVLSSNFDAINKAVEQGSKLENLSTAPMALVAPEKYNPYR